MNAKRLLAYYHRIADSPDAIPRLRRFILDLAVRGKLVPQKPSDEPASELLERIAAKRKLQTKNGKSKGQQSAPTSYEPPFSIPENCVGQEWPRSVS
jgi:type I restriction enzyme S subunit